MRTYLAHSVSKCWDDACARHELHNLTELLRVDQPKGNITGTNTVRKQYRVANLKACC
jgi:hypothetical protein